MADFETFWSEYPKKVDKKYARLAFEKLTPLQKNAAQIAIPLHAKMWAAEGREQRHIPHAATWIHAERFEDELEMPEPQGFAWWSSEIGVQRKARELGVNARPGESMDSFVARLKAAA